MAHRVAALMAVLLPALLATACGRDEARNSALVERAIEATGEPVAPAGEAPAIDEHIVTLETEDGLYTATSGDDLALPPGFPDDVQLPADARVQAYTTLGEAVSVGLHSPRSASLLFDEFRAAQRARGWQEAEAIELAPVQSLGLRKDSRLLEATFTAEADGGTAVSLALRPAGD